MNEIMDVSRFTPGVGGLVARELVRVCDGEMIIDSMTIAAEFGRRHDNVLAALRALIDGGTISPLDCKERQYRDTRGKMQPCIELTEEGALVGMPFVGGRKSREGQATLVRAFLATRARLRALQAAPALAVEAPVMGKLTAEMAVAECMARLSNVSESGKLAMLHTICRKHGVDTHFLPRQTVDGPPGVMSSPEAESATVLLGRRGKGASAISFNRRAKLAGYLRETSRPTNDREKHPDGRKRYLVITKKGEQFGKNVVDIQSPRQSQPRWYSQTFDAFCKLLWSETRDLVEP